MEFADKLIELRRKKGWSQETLADYLNVSRQAVSKWEAGRTLPDIPRLVSLADLFGVSLDELLRDKATAQPAEGPVAMGPLVAVNTLMRHEYKSKITVFGIPLVHICIRRFGAGPLSVAKGIIAVGDVAVGAVALGGVSMGLLSFGGISLGLLLALGGVAIGGVAFGGLALGYFALGGLALGVCSLGGAAFGLQAAVGGGAFAPVAMGGGGSGQYTFFDGAQLPDIDTFMQTAKQYAPAVPRFFLRLMHALGA